MGLRFYGMEPTFSWYGIDFTMHHLCRFISAYWLVVPVETKQFHNRKMIHSVSREYQSAGHNGALRT